MFHDSADIRKKCIELRFDFVLRLKKPLSRRVQDMWHRITSRDPDQPEFLQSVEGVLNSIVPVLKKRPELIPVLERMLEPERQIVFRVHLFAVSSLLCTTGLMDG